MASKTEEKSDPDYRDGCDQVICNYPGAMGFTESNEIGKEGTKLSVATHEESSPQPIYNQYIIDKVENLNFGVPGAPPLSSQTIPSQDEVHPETSIASQQEIEPNIPRTTQDTQSLSDKRNTKTQEKPTLNIQPKKNFFKKLMKLGTTDGLRSKLQQSYKEATIPCIPWLNKGRDLVMSEYYTELELDASDTIIPLKDIFNNIDKKHPRILIEGQPGYGKTTLATKLVYDWALSKSYIKHFKLVFLLPMREIQQRSVTKVISDTARCCGYSNTDKINDIVQNNMSQTLLVFDGLDELPINERMPILRVLYRHEFIDATVIVTCRTGLFTLEHSEQTLLSGGLSKKKEFYDRRVNVLGIRIEDRETFLLKFVSPETTAVIMESIKQLSESATIMFGSPLFLILLAFMASKTSNLTSLRTKTQFFKRLFNYLVNHSMKKMSNRLDEEIDLFQIDLPINQVQKTVQKFGELSLYHIRANKLQFEHNKLTTKVYNMGFLINHKEISTFDSRCNYEAFHLTILEFAIAFSIWIDFKQKSTRKSFDCFVPLYLELGQTSLIFSFLVGLLQEDAAELFQHISPYAYFFSMSPNSLWYILTDYEENSNLNTLLPVLVDFIPQNVNPADELLDNFYASNLWTEILKFGIQIGRIKRISFGWTTFPNLPRDVVLPTVSLLILSAPSPRFRENLSDIKCEKMIVEFSSYLVESNTPDSDFLSLIRYLSSITLKSFSIKMLFVLKAETPRTPKPFLDCVENVEFSSFSVVMEHFFEMEIACNLLQRNQIQSLEVFSEAENSATILDFIINSSKLTSLQINRLKNAQIDLHGLTKGGEKQYNSITLKINQVVCTEPLADKNCVHHLNIKEIENRKASSDVLNAINPVILECNASAVGRLPSSWTGYLKIKELAVNFDIHLNEVQFWEDLSCFKNLSTLELALPNDFPMSQVIENETVSCLQQLPIETLAISSRILDRIASSLLTENTSELILNCPNKIVVFLTESDIKFEVNAHSIVNVLFECCRLNRLNSFCIISDNNSLRKYLIEGETIDYSVFSVSHVIYGCSSSDPNYKQILYDADPSSFSQSNNICLEIKKKKL